MCNNTIFPREVIRVANILAFTLVAAYIISLGASLHWIADLFRHFMHQYFIGCITLAPVMFYFRRFMTSAVLIVILCLSFYEIYNSSEYVQPVSQTHSNNLKIVHYNRHYNLHDHRAMTEWITKENPDIFVIQETGETHSKAIESLRELYPYQIHEPRKNAFGLILASKHKIIQSVTHKNIRYALDNLYVHALIQISDGQRISIYTSHPPPPTSALLQTQRNQDISVVVDAIQEDSTANIIFMGDWNITPYSPHFQTILQETGLKNQHNSFYSPPTWPSVFPLPILQIPIDHILHKGDLHLTSKRKGPHLGSDHFPVIAEFSLPEHTVYPQE